MAMVREVERFADILPIEQHAARDSALMARLASGDDTALGELNDLWCDAVHALVARSVHDDGDAERIVEEVFVDAWLNAATYCRARGSPRLWLLSLASVRTRNFMHSARDSPDDASNHDARFACTESILRRDSAGSTCAALGALLRLPREQRIGLELACFDGFLLADIALRLGVPLQAAQSHVREALRAVSMLLTSPESAASRQSAPVWGC